MAECTICNICDKPGTFQLAREAIQVACHVKRFSTDKFTVWRCSNCSSLHSKEDVDLMPYYTNYPFKNHKLDYHTRHGYRNRLRLLRSQAFGPELSVLDYGCGQGLYVKFLREHGFQDAQGFDPFSEDFSDPKVLDREYDLVVSHDVIEHVESPGEYLETLLGLLKPKGHLVLGTPNAAEISLQYNGPAPIELSQPYHRHIFSQKALLDLAAHYGLYPQTIYNRFYFDTLYPGVNTRFMWEYINKTGGLIDVAVEPIKWNVVLKSPKLMTLAIMGYFWRSPGNMLISFASNASKGVQRHREVRDAANA